MNYVFDSSSLIYLGKAKILEKVILLEGNKIIPQRVYEEVVMKGLERKDEEAEYVYSFIQNKRIVVEHVEKIIIDNELLSEADIEVLSLAKEINGFCIMDELYGRNVGKSLGIKVHGSSWILLQLVKRKVISKNECKKYLEEMIGKGFYLSVEMYKLILNKIEEI